MGKNETIERLISCGYLKSPKLKRAMERIDRALFVPEAMKRFAWDDRPLPIGHGQTISAPHMYAFMLEAADIRLGARVLEIGTGSGYGAALISVLVGAKGKVFSIEIVHELSEFARGNLKQAELDNVEVIDGDGADGYSERAPFSRILVTAACESVPPALFSQLEIGGRLLAPVGKYSQDLMLFEKLEGEIRATSLLPVLFVPLVRKS